MKADVLHILKEAREVLSASWIPLCRADSAGGHCALGALEVAAGLRLRGHERLIDRSTLIESTRPDIVAMLNESARKIFPKLAAALHEYHSIYLITTVNNDYGRDAILAVFDDAIERAELNQLCAEVEHDITREFAYTIVQAVSSALAQADNDLKATTGIYDASLGAPGPEQSGKAIIGRMRSSICEPSEAPLTELGGSQPAFPAQPESGVGFHSS